MKYLKSAVLLLILMTGCTTQGIKGDQDIAAWAGKAAQAGCSHSSGERMIDVVNVPVAKTFTGNIMLPVMMKLDVSTVEKRIAGLLSKPTPDPILVLSKINSHALSTVENLIKRWEGAAPAPMLCVFADGNRAENLRQLAQEKGFNVHITSLSVMQENAN